MCSVTPTAMAWNGSHPYVLNSDALPIAPDGLVLESHRPQGIQLFSARQTLEFWRSPKQKKGKTISGAEFWESIENLPFLNAQAMYLLLAERELLSDFNADGDSGGTRGKRLIFPGTIYRDGEGRRILAAMHRDRGDGSWHECGSHDTHFDADDYVVLLRRGSN